MAEMIAATIRYTDKPAIIFQIIEAILCCA